MIIPIMYTVEFSASLSNFSLLPDIRNVTIMIIFVFKQSFKNNVFVLKNLDADIY